MRFHDIFSEFTALHHHHHSPISEHVHPPQNILCDHLSEGLGLGRSGAGMEMGIGRSFPGDSGTVVVGDTLDPNHVGETFPKGSMHRGGAALLLRTLGWLLHKDAGASSGKK